MPSLDLSQPNVPLSKAFAFARDAHRGQKDKAGFHYIEHPLRVAGDLQDLFLLEEERISNPYIITALLHDVLEDTNATAEQIRQEFGDEVATAVMVLTRGEGQSYDEYLAAVKLNPIAREVKLADIRDNTRIDRLHYLEDATVKYLQSKYLKAYRYLVNDEPSKEASKEVTV